MPGRKFDTDGYRYGFNGKENDNEVKGEGNSINLGARMFDSRLGRFFAVDPWTDKYAWQTPYAYHRNSPIAYIDWNGYGDPPKWWTNMLNGLNRVFVEPIQNEGIRRAEQYRIHGPPERSGPRKITNNRIIDAWLHIGGSSMFMDAWENKHTHSRGVFFMNSMLALDGFASFAVVSRKSTARSISRLGRNKYNTVEVDINNIQALHGIKKSHGKEGVKKLSDDFATNGYNLESWPPIEGVQISENTTLVFDGTHRTLGFAMNGAETVPMRIRQASDVPADQMRLMLKVGEMSGTYMPHQYPEGFAVPDLGVMENTIIDIQAAQFVKENFK